MEEVKRTLAREELHELVWSTPIQKLAGQYGLSDRGFAKICERHLVPVPPRGYWAKIEAGQPVKVTALRRVQDTSLQTVHIGSRVAKMQSDYLAEVLAAAKLGIVSPKSELPAVPRNPPKTTSPEILSVATRGDVGSFLKELQRLKPDRDGFVYHRYVKVPPAAITRVGNFLSLIANTLQPFGFRLHDNKTTRLGFSKNGYVVDFGIDAPRKRVTKTSGGWHSQEYEHVGRLELTIYGRAEGSKKKWIDTDNRKIEESLSQIVDSFLVNHIVEGEHEARRKTEEARRAHLVRRRELAALRIKREDDRLSFLRWIAEARREAEDLRATIASVPTSGDLPHDYARMIAWAGNRLAELDEQTAIDRIQATLVDRRLYSDPDDLLDPEGDPPPKQNYWDD
ncbi:hypothetical protein OE766_03480 [Pararhizobium sp. YC-54]|uniref:hypothetical protein n=1 Tax=Pararhizobium sp. YC-54 TaxID=2986920 RepID=UPI0021F76FE2|nr:hypothetical protein [Pararhizobium sp. YC-54]MCV9997299.1 hypothetical protein [Pararhizobium sp. YC-54]